MRTEAFQVPEVIVPTLTRFESVVTEAIEEVAFSTLPLFNAVKLLLSEVGRLEIRSPLFIVVTEVPNGAVE